MALAEAWDDHEQHLIGDEAEIPENLGDLVDVDRTIRAVLWRRRKIEQAEMMAQATIDKAKDYLEAQRRRFDPSWLEERLRAYHEARLRDDSKAKSLDFPAGSLRARKAPDRVEVDESEFFAANPDDELVHIRKAPSKSAIAQRIKTTGEVIPGCELVVGTTRFTVQESE